MCFSMGTENRNLLVEGAKAFGIDLAEQTVEAFDLYLRELLKWNEKMNLTAIRSEKGIVLKHFLDSLSVFPHLPGISSLLDIGSGAGFPGIPLKMVQPSLEVTLIDSVRKKVDFQNHVIRTLGLKGIEAIHGRVQDREILEGLGGRFDGTIARAFSDLDTLLLLSFPFLKKGGILLAMKGEGAGKELKRLPLSTRNRYRWIKTATFSLPFSSIKRSIILFEKL
ncbi:MAG: 16S rRNA (guanine(527)-N(7))-methyltransferase RsmG [Deltaproteobacteria bacterium]|nr:16S rRNA (guanine(527)-N(7))-methyltransferase RsmG [Deltaproteobacteria bacterium]